MDEEVIGILRSIQDDIKSIKANQEEHGQILRALDERTQIMSAKTENLEFNMAEVKGSINQLKDDVLEINENLSSVEVITAKNWADIARLKAK